MSTLDLSALIFDREGLIPGIVQAPSGEVRMMGYFNREALEQTLKSGWVTFWSRSRQRLWMKGESSGHRLRFIQVHPDCDGDALLIIAEPQGPTCHRGTESCFDGVEVAATTLPWLQRLEALLQRRKGTASPEGSYTQRLFAQGTDRIAKKVVEEAGEVILAVKNPDREAFLDEAADLLFHLQLLLVDRSSSLQEVVRVLQGRHREER